MTEAVEKQTMTRFEKTAIAVSVAGFALIGVGGFVLYGKMTHATQCIQLAQANEAYGLTKLPEGDDENSRALRAMLEECGIQFTEADGS